eukprot:TRINITY_DN28699_c0_g1_i1.p1 TRINITY_DN28699_c0_g1~~TRINITY_DN28699_c0_g1_i1.p1  ORF type:complete len:104 (+),score=9.43 TRINITY_DN28699_c0_g1_i1:376-687(+)
MRWKFRSIFQHFTWAPGSKYLVKWRVNLDIADGINFGCLSGDERVNCFVIATCHFDKKGIFTRQVTPATLYGAESWATKRRKAMVHVVEMHMLRGMCGVSGKE